MFASNTVPCFCFTLVGLAGADSVVYFPYKWCFRGALVWTGVERSAILVCRDLLECAGVDACGAHRVG